MLATIATPFGLRLLPVPFTPLGLLSSEIFETRPLTWRDHSFDATLVPSFGALRALLVAIVAIAVAGSLARKTVALRHLIWCAGGAFLLLRAERFPVESTLLALPLVTHAPWLCEVRVPGSPRVASALLLAAVIAFGTARFLQVTRGPSRLPGGAACCHRAPPRCWPHAGSGRVLHHPNYGGYLEWAFGDRLSIAADMQTPFLFDGARVLELTAAYADGASLRAVAQRWKADYVLLQWRDAQALAPALADAYALVGFDDVALAYAHRQRAAALVARAELRALTPQALQALLARRLPPEALGAVATELERFAKLGESAVVRAAQALVAEQRVRAMPRANTPRLPRRSHRISRRFSGSRATSHPAMAMRSARFCTSRAV